MNGFIEKQHQTVISLRVLIESAKTDGFGALLEVAMSKKCTALWREAHLEVKNVKN